MECTKGFVKQMRFTVLRLE